MTDDRRVDSSDDPYSPLCKSDVDEKLMRLSIRVDSGFHEIEKRVLRNEERIAHHVETRVPSMETRLSVLEQSVSSISSNISDFRRDTDQDINTFRADIHENVADFRSHIDGVMDTLTNKLDHHIENDTTKLSRLFVSTWAQFLGVIITLVLLYLAGILK